MLTSSLEVQRIWCRLNSVKLNFVKTGLKFEFGVNPQSFSHVLCLYITRFPPGWRYTARLINKSPRPLTKVTPTRKGLGTKLR